MPHYDAILIPGGGIGADGEPHPWVKARLDHAIALHDAEYLITLSAGTVHKPLPLDEHGSPIFEALAAARYLSKHGIHPDMILAETCSYDTIGNAYFSRVIHVEPAGLRKLCVITSEFHMPRTRAIFEWLYGLDSSHVNYHLSFVAVPDIGIAPADLQARMDKEAHSLQQFQNNVVGIENLRACHRWLFTEHAAYAAEREPRRTMGNALNTY